jgi:hypothetical protein
MRKIPALVLSIALAAGTLPATPSYGHQPVAPLAISPGIPDGDILLVQAPGSGWGPGVPGSGWGPGRVYCRWVRGEPGSGSGPQRVCERIPRCRTVVIPGSGQGPQRVCD